MKERSRRKGISKINHKGKATRARFELDIDHVTMRLRLHHQPAHPMSRRRHYKRHLNPIIVHLLLHHSPTRLQIHFTLLRRTTTRRRPRSRIGIGRRIGRRRRRGRLNRPPPPSLLTRRPALRLLALTLLTHIHILHHAHIQAHASHPIHTHPPHPLHHARSTHHIQPMVRMVAIHTHVPMYHHLLIVLAIPLRHTRQHPKMVTMMMLVLMPLLHPMVLLLLLLLLVPMHPVSLLLLLLAIRAEVKLHPHKSIMKHHTILPLLASLTLLLTLQILLALLFQRPHPHIPAPIIHVFLNLHIILRIFRFPIWGPRVAISVGVRRR
ncbi:hypothetical protein BJ165DRAFT_1418451 [Panaeolus papilionaceus]|nr:hypothetical protein BJ165DRAFT_1418451 [Panaeolus papilionaceus]